MDSLITFDQHLLLALNGSDSIFWDGFWLSITSVGTWILFYLSIFFLFVRTNNLRQLALLLLMVGLAILLADQISSSLCKPFFHRFRPTHEPILAGQVDVVDGYVGGLYGFISSHAANSFAIATFVSLVIRYRWCTMAAFGYACFSSFSRIYLGVHYPGDILCGAICGALCGSLIYLLYLYICSRGDNQRQYYSDTYTRTGYLKEDCSIVPLALGITLLYAIFSALFYSLSH